MVERLRGSAGKKQRERRMRRSFGLCELCQAKGLTVFAKVVDHIVPLAKGGSDDDANTQNLCTPCHDLKTRDDFGLRPARATIGADGWPIA
jgi:5-methylcytosine-specific restriction protein A